MRALQGRVVLGSGCRGVILYGRRKTGKSTVLHNLSRFLPPTIHTAYVSMEHQEASRSVESFVELLIKRILAACPGTDWAAGGDGVLRLVRFLEAANGVLEKRDRRLLIALDEYNFIDHLMTEGTYKEDVLRALRESIQSHGRLTWVFAGSQAITELRSPSWTSCLIAAQTVNVPMFSEDETRMLFTQPFEHAGLWLTGSAPASRATVPPAFWGCEGIQRVHEVAGGWPFFVQLVGSCACELADEARRVTVDGPFLERVFDAAVSAGDSTLSHIMWRESTLEGEWDYLLRFRNTDAQPPPVDDSIARSLRHRLLVAEDSNGWRLRVPLMRRWLRHGAH
jgi:hypothetical protein